MPETGREPEAPAASEPEAAPVRRRRSAAAEQPAGPEIVDNQPARRRSRLHRLLTDEETNTSYGYTAVPTAGSREEKYSAPYYPPQYRQNDEKERPAP